MLSAREASAYTSLRTPDEFSMYKHLEIRIMDTVRNCGTYIMHAGELSEGVIKCFVILGYTITGLILR